MDDLSLEHPDLEEFFDEGAGVMPAAVREHLSECHACAATLAEMAELRHRARRLPREIQPERELWSGIAARISGASAARRVVPGLTELRPRPARRVAWPSLAAAAVLLVVVSSGVTAYLLRGAGEASAPAAAAGDASAPAAAAGDASAPTAAAGEASGAPGPMGLAAFAASEAEYRYTVETLEAELEARRSTLSPATIQTVEQNLAIIDNAIEEARRALAADPTSADLPLLLSGVYRQKVELLQRAVDLSARS